MLIHAPWTAVPGLRHAFLDRRESAGPARVDAAGGGGPLPVAIPRQVHGTRVVTADCVPVLLVDPARRVAAAVHAGWRGTAAGVLEAALGHLEAAYGTGPQDLHAAVGPAIGGCCFEIGPEVIDALRARTGELTAAAWLPRPGRWHVDLRQAVRLLLAAAGVQATMLGPCTACDGRFHSYRRDGAGAGRQLSFVGWA